MRGYRFYEEYVNKRARRSTGNCLAAALDCSANPGRIMTASAVLFTPNSFTNWGEVDYTYLRENCRRVSEQVARTIHPNLFVALEG